MKIINPKTTIMENMMNKNHGNEPSFESYCQEAHAYFNDLAEDLGQPSEENRVIMAWKAVMHCIRDRIQISESLDFISSLPMLLKAMYVQNWKYHTKPPLNYGTIEEMNASIKDFQDQYGEFQFDWDKPTEEIFAIVLSSLQKYLSEGSIEHIKGQMPKEVQEIFAEV